MNRLLILLFTVRSTLGARSVCWRGAQWPLESWRFPLRCGGDCHDREWYNWRGGSLTSKRVAAVLMLAGCSNRLFQIRWSLNDSAEALNGNSRPRFIVKNIFRW